MGGVLQHVVQHQLLVFHFLEFMGMIVVTEFLNVVHTSVMCLLKDQCVVCIVVRKEQKLCAAVFDLLELYREVCVAVCCVCFVSYNFKTVLVCCCNECIVDTGVVVCG